MIRIVPGACVRRASPRASCTACEIACPRHLLRLEPTGPAAGDGCDDCGLCAAACPVDAIRDERSRRPAAGAGPARNRRLACAPASRPGEPSVPCLGALRPADVLDELAHAPGEALVLRHADCAACPRLPAGADAGRAARAVATLGLRLSSLAEALGFPPGRLRLEPAAGGGGTGPSGGNGPEQKPASHAVSRRGFLSSLLPVGVADRKPGAAAEGPVASRRRLLHHLRQQTAPLAAAARLVFRFAPAPGCDGCAVCSILCPTGALGTCDAGGMRSLHHDVLRCVGCGLCVDVCRLPEARLEPCDAAPGVLGTAGAPRELVRLSGVRCEGCGQQSFRGAGATGPSVCFVCEARRSRVGPAPPATVAPDAGAASSETPGGPAPDSQGAVER